MSRRSSATSSLSMECASVSNERIKQFKVNHLDQFQILATMHLSFLMDLNDTGLEEIIDDSDAVETGASEKVKAVFSSIWKKNPKGLCNDGGDRGVTVGMTIVIISLFSFKTEWMITGHYRSRT